MSYVNGPKGEGERDEQTPEPKVVDFHLHRMETAEERERHPRLYSSWKEKLYSRLKDYAGAKRS